MSEPCTHPCDTEGCVRTCSRPAHGDMGTHYHQTTDSCHEWGTAYAGPQARTQSARRGRLQAVREQIEPPTTVGPIDPDLIYTAGHRDGDTYEAEFDYERLNDQSKRVYNAMFAGDWLTLSEIATRTGDPEASVSARLRDFRKPRFGALTVERRARERESGVFEYRLLPPSPGAATG